MPVILFDDVDTLRLALTSGAVPASIVRGPARAGFDTQGRLWLQPAGELPRRAITAITRLGAKVQGTSGVELVEGVSTWLELLPLAPAPLDADTRPNRALFDLAFAQELPALVAEGRRLGAGAIEVCVTGDSRIELWDGQEENGERTQQTAESANPVPDPVARCSGRAFALMESPPYHSLLRAIDRGNSTRVYVEQLPHIWVEVGWSHPAAEMIKVKDGCELLIRSPRTWEQIPQLDVRRGPKSFALPPSQELQARSEIVTLPVALGLARARVAEAPDFWVITAAPFEQLRQLAEHCDDRLISRLSVAIVENGQVAIAVLRAIPRRSGPPTLVLDALPCRPYMRLPNLYLPTGRRLTPPLRRDLVRQCLAPDPERVTWLSPENGRGFAVHSLEQTAFHPLEQVVSYVQSIAPQPFVYQETARIFAPVPFIVREGRPPPASRQAGAIAVEPENPRPRVEEKQPGLIQRIVRWMAPRSPEPSPPARHRSQRSAIVQQAPSFESMDERRRMLEGQFVASLNSPGAAQLQRLWPDLAEAYSALSRHRDAALCWLNALWEMDEPPVAWRENWLRSEATSAHGSGTDGDLHHWLSTQPSPTSIRALAAYANWAVAQEPPPHPFVESLQQVHNVISEHEDWLPARAAWLANRSLAEAAGADAVGLARARDRLLQRLHERGLSADMDLPPALRFSDVEERIEAVRRWLNGARGPIHRWLGAQASASDALQGADSLQTARDPRLQAFGLGSATGPTRAYSDLILAWALSRIGERTSGQELLSQSRGVLSQLDEAHQILLGAFAYRIGQASEGRSGGPLPSEIQARLAQLEQLERDDPAARERMLLFKAERLRQYSRILEPAERVYAFREGWLDPHAIPESDRELGGLRTIVDPEELAQRLLSIVASAARDTDRLPIVLATALDLAPRLGESIANVILQRFLGVLDTWSFAGPPDQVEAEVSALERGLFVAAHFDQPIVVQRLMSSLSRLLESRRGGELGEDRTIEDALLSVISQSLRGLRRLGLRAEADQLLDRLSIWASPSHDFAAERRRRPQVWPLTLRRLLTLAGGWFYVGRDQPAIDVLDEARRWLFAGNATPQERRAHTDLACAYASALGLAPVQLAINRIEEMFEQFHGVNDTFITNTHYSLAKLRVVEAAVMAVVTDDFVLGPAVRRWLDDDEYRVRRKIHRDTRRIIEIPQ